MDDLLPQIFQDFIQVMYQFIRVLRENSRVSISQGHFRGAEGGPFSLVMCPVIFCKVMLVRERCSCDWEVELTQVTPGAGVATQSRQGWSEAATCWASGSPSAFQVSL